MTLQLLYANNAKTTLAAPISSGVTTITVAAGTGSLFPNPGSNQYFVITMIPASSGIPGEIMWCTARSGDSLTVTRGQEGTTASSYAAGDNVSNQVTQGGLAAVLQLPTYAGNPNGFLAGQAGNATTAPSAVWDTVHSTIWVCTTASTNPAAAVWTQSGVVTLSPANPTAVAGPSANNGSAATYMRSDASPAVQLGSASQAGLLQVDGTSIVASSGIISAVTGTPPPGATTRLSANLSSPGASVQFTADYVAVANTIGGTSYVLANYNRTLNTATTGANGMDTGGPPASGFVSIYAIYNPSTSTAAILGTTQCQTTVYTGVNMPSGYTASSLIAIWPTNSSAQLYPCSVIDRALYFQFSGQPNQTPLSGGSATVATAVSISGLIPAAVRTFYANYIITDSSPSHLGTAGATNGVHQIILSSIAGVQVNEQAWMPIVTAGTVYYLVFASTAQFTIQLLGYSI